MLDHLSNIRLTRVNLSDDYEIDLLESEDDDEEVDKDEEDDDADDSANADGGDDEVDNDGNAVMTSAEQILKRHTLFDAEEKSNEAREWIH